MDVDTSCQHVDVDMQDACSSQRLSKNGIGDALGLVWSLAAAGKSWRQHQKH